MRKILIVGDEPSKLNTSPSIAFVGAKCYPRLKLWLALLQIVDYELVNSHSEDCIAYISAWKKGPIIALGGKVQKRLLKAGIMHLSLPHPSGRNRQINDSALINEKLTQVWQQLADKLCMEVQND